MSGKHENIIFPMWCYEQHGKSQCVILVVWHVSNMDPHSFGVLSSYHGTKERPNHTPHPKWHEGNLFNIKILIKDLKLPNCYVAFLNFKKPQ